MFRSGHSKWSNKTFAHYGFGEFICKGKPSKIFTGKSQFIASVLIIFVRYTQYMFSLSGGNQ